MIFRRGVGRRLKRLGESDKGLGDVKLKLGSGGVSEQGTGVSVVIPFANVLISAKSAQIRCIGHKFVRRRQWQKSKLMRRLLQNTATTY